MTKKETKEQEQIRKLKEREQQIKNKIKDKQKKVQRKERKEETRRKILAGAAVLDKVKRGDWPDGKFKNLMHEFLEKDTDRELFGLAPLPKDTPEVENPPEEDPQ